MLTLKHLMQDYNSAEKNTGLCMYYSARTGGCRSEASVKPGCYNGKTRRCSVHGIALERTEHILTRPFASLWAE